MKKLIYLLSFALIASITFISCDDDEEKKESPFKTVTLGAQENKSIKGFYSITNDKTYTLDEAAQDKANIDLLCYYDGDKNLMTLSSPGANLDGVFSGDNDPELWTIADTTYFYQVDNTVFTTLLFDALTEESTEIETLFVEADAKRKAKQLKVDDMYAFLTEDNHYGILKINSVTEGTTGQIEFEYIIKK